MQLAPIPENERQRLEAVQRLGILDTQPEERFDRLTTAARQQLHAPISTISIIDQDREWYKSCQGVGLKEGARDISFCGHAMLSSHVFIVEDTLQDPRFADNPNVIGGQKIRFYAGVALHDQQTHLPVGVLCIKDYQPRQMSAADIDILLQLAAQAEAELNRQPS